MVLYEYVCDTCGAKFDAFRSMKDADQPIHCKKCHGLNTHRTLSMFYASSEGRSVAGSSSCCGTCSGGGCSGCSH
ncbi:MAG: zinc ribbon domain-containing protein [Chloroflexota bacterium]